MTRKFQKRSLIYITFALLVAGCGEPATSPQPAGVPERIISLAPNITETIFALGLGDKLVGATTQCTYPQAANSVPRVGDYGQFSYEAMVSLNPDLVILHHEYEAEKQMLAGLKIPYLETGSYLIDDILASIHSIGKICNAVPAAKKLCREINARISTLQIQTEAPQRVLMVFASEDSGSIHAFGTQCLHNELLDIVGGQNVIEGKLPFATLSQEAVIRLNPDVIIELAPGTDPAKHTTNRWEDLHSVSAVIKGRIYRLTGDYTCIPGPRFVQTLEDFSRIIRQNDAGRKETISTGQ